MRVAMLIQGFHPRIGGAERQLLQLIPRLQACGVDVHVVTRRYPGLLPIEEVDGIPVHRVAVPGPKPLASLAFTAGATATLHRIRPDLLHAHELLSPTTTAVLAGAILSVPVVAKVLISGEVQRLVEERALGTRRMALFRSRVARFITISDDIEQELVAYGVPSDRQRFVPNGVDTSRFAPPAPEVRREARAALGLDGCPVAVFTGRLEPQKNLPTLLSAWTRVRRCLPDAQLLIAGDGSQRKLLRRAAGAGVNMLGPVDDVAGLLAAADVFILPSWREGLSNSLLEAMASGLPVVASAVGGTAELLEDGRSGRLFAPDDIAALVDALVEILGDPALGRQLAAGARRTVEEGYALDAQARRLVELYEEVLA